jgi:N6-adenosine-specific RNA methylase IME4
VADATNLELVRSEGAVALDIAGIRLDSYEHHVEAWKWLDRHEDDVNWHRGAVANSLVVKYGDGTLERFAGDVGCTSRAIRHYRAVAAEYLENGNRFPNLTWTHHYRALDAPPSARTPLLEEALENAWSVRDLAKAITQRFRRETPPLPNPSAESGRYSTVVADPPWAYDEGWPEYNDQVGQKNQRIALPYQSMSLDEIRNLDVKGLSAENAHLFLWTTNRYVRDAYDVAESWGFSPSQLLTWCKPPRGIGPGGIFSNTTEFVVYARRGKPEHKERTDSTWWEWPRGKHSAKPALFMEMVERMCVGPYLEMFSRSPRSGWEAWGLEAA